MFDSVTGGMKSGILEAVISASTGPVAIVSDEHHFISINQSFCNLVHGAKKDFQKLYCFELIGRRDSPHDNCPLETFKNNSRENITESFTDIIEGEEFYISCSSFSDFYEKTHPITGCVHFLETKKSIFSDRNRSYGEDLDSEMEQLLQIFHSIRKCCHALSQPMQAAIGYAELLSIEEPEGKTGEKVKKILCHLNEALSIIEQIREFARKVKME